LILKSFLKFSIIEFIINSSKVSGDKQLLDMFVTISKKKSTKMLWSSEIIYSFKKNLMKLISIWSCWKPFFENLFILINSFIVLSSILDTPYKISCGEIMFWSYIDSFLIINDFISFCILLTFLSFFPRNVSVINPPFFS